MPTEKYQELLAVKSTYYRSVGRYFANQIRPVYQGTRVDGLEESA